MGNGPRQVTVSDRSVLAPPRAVPSRSINGLWGSACGARVVRASRAQIALAWVEDEAPGIVVELDLVQVELDQIGVTARPDQHWTTRVSARLTIAERVPEEGNLLHKSLQPANCSIAPCAALRDIAYSSLGARGWGLNNRESVKQRGQEHAGTPCSTCACGS